MEIGQLAIMVIPGFTQLRISVVHLRMQDHSRTPYEDFAFGRSYNTTRSVSIRVMSRWLLLSLSARKGDTLFFGITSPLTLELPHHFLG